MASRKCSTCSTVRTTGPSTSQKPASISASRWRARICRTRREACSSASASRSKRASFVMRKIVWAVVALLVPVLSVVARSQQPAGKDLSWAFPVINGALPAEESGPKNVPGSAKSYTPAQIDDLLNPPDWFPDEHPPAPPIVQKGHGAALACGSCHLMSGHGHPESAGMNGFTADYIVQQMADFKSGMRKDAARMNGIAKALSDEESRQAAEWFALLKPAPWTKVIEAETVPKTIVAQGRMRFVQPGGGTEPI